MNIAALLIHDETVPREVRDALRTASVAAPADRDLALTRAARILYDATDLDCRDVRDLVGLAPSPECT